LIFFHNDCIKIVQYEKSRQKPDFLVGIGIYARDILTQYDRTIKRVQIFVAKLNKAIKIAQITRLLLLISQIGTLIFGDIKIKRYFYN